MMEAGVKETACAAARAAIDNFFIPELSATHPDKVLLLDTFMSHVFNMATGVVQCTLCANIGAHIMRTGVGPPLAGNNYRVFEPKRVEKEGVQ